MAMTASSRAPQGAGSPESERSPFARLTELLAPRTLRSIAEVGIDPDFIEASAFAWLARQRLLGLPGNLPAVTGAQGPRVLGAIYSAPASGSSSSPRVFSGAS